MRRHNFIFVLITIFLVGVIGFCIGGTVKGQSSQNEAEMLYQIREAALLRETREYLDQSGFQHSGVTLNRVVDEDGRRSYTFTIHHGRIDKMNEKERQILQNKLMSFCRGKVEDFPEDICTFCYEFLILQATR